MRKGLFLSALLASIFVTGAALADRSDDNDSKQRSRSLNIKDQVLERQREARSSHVTKDKATDTRGAKALDQRLARSRPHGDVYGDQATRSMTKSVVTTASGRNMSGSNAVNTPREIKQMLRMINPMLGAYRTSQASEGTDSYGGESMVPNGKGEGSRARNLSATGAVNTPAEIKQMLRMINPMFGAYRTSQAAEGTDSYGGDPVASAQNRLAAGVKTTAQRSTNVRETVERVVKTKTQSEAPVKASERGN
jgi:hypothetical protein